MEAGGLVRVRVGPVRGAVARAWIGHNRALMRALLADLDGTSIDVDVAGVSLLDTILELWAEQARDAEVFEWRIEASPSIVLDVASAWFITGQLTDDDHARLGTAWAPAWTDPMSAAVFDSITRALTDIGAPAADLHRQILVHYGLAGGGFGWA